jgi:SAM-dependent methyltransferase
MTEVDSIPEITKDRLLDVFFLKHGPLHRTGWGPRQRFKFGYFTPDDIYECLISSLVTRETTWLDVGGGRELFPGNANLSGLLSNRCRRLVGVDPSDNIHENPYLHARAQCLIEDYAGDSRFSLITLRMVAEHIQNPESAMRAMRNLLEPGGKLIIYTVDCWAPVSVLSAIVPFWLHHRIKKLFWGSQQRDTFPVAYKMNRPGALKRLATAFNLEPVSVSVIPDCRIFAAFRVLNWLELCFWRACRAFQLPYPESCILAVFERCN